MKKYVLSALAFCFAFNLSAQENDPIVMTVAGEGIKKSEFEYIYNKNNTNNAIDKKDLNEYAQLYADLKLKVAEARALGLDTTEAFKTELQNYRSQSAKQYLKDEELTEKMIKEAYNRFKEELNVSHILIMVPQTALPKDTLEAYQKALAVRKRLDKEAFDVVAKEISEDKGTAVKGGKIGFITSFSTVLPFENAAYSLSVGEISKPVRSNFGYHIIKLNEKRPSQGYVHVAHIMKTYPPMGHDLEKQLREKIDSVYTKLLAGSDFTTVAQEESDHIFSARKGGELGWYSVGRSGVGEEFEETGFALKVGEFSAPVKSIYGYHIIKLLDRKPLESFEDKKEEISKYLEMGDRKEFLDNAFKNKIRKEYNLQISDSALLVFAESKLEEKYPEFRMLMQEYNDGILMFDISTKEVWEKASEDTDGLKSFFEANKKNYTWDTPRFKGMIVYAKDKKTEKRAKKIIKSSSDEDVVSNLKALNTDEETFVKIDKGLFVKGENKAADKLVFKEGNFVPADDLPIVFTDGKILADGPEDYIDMKGVVISDYQNYLQEKWINKLREKYPVVIYEEVLEAIK
jgi:peptidyl-prolyl cis-trans isomerase SurA